MQGYGNWKTEIKCCFCRDKCGTSSRISHIL